MLWLSRLFRRTKQDAQLDSELRFHIEQQTADNIAAGMTPNEARRRALAQFGGLEYIKEETRDARGTQFIDSLLQDIRFALRMLRKSPGFTVVAVLTLALGIGANTAIFSLIDAWMIKPLPYPQPNLLMVFSTEQMRGGWTSHELSHGDFYDFQRLNHSFAQLAAWAGWDYNLTGDGPPVFLDGGLVSWNFFDTLGAKPMLGRTFLPDEDRPGAPHVAVISEGLWKSRFGSDPHIIGRRVTIDDQSYAIVGVMPGTFQYPLMGISNLWVPLALTDANRSDRSQRGLQAFGRLKSGVTEKEAAAECATISASIAKRYPRTNAEISWTISPMWYEISLEEGLGPMIVFLCVVGLILLIACANVSTLMLARAARRTKEFAVRGALGATKPRLIRQLLTETALLFLMGGAAGILVGQAGVSWIESLIPGHTRGFIVNYGHVKLDVTTLCFTLCTALACAFIFGMAPALANSKLDVNHVLKEVSAQSSAGKKPARLAQTVVTVEVALAVVVLVATVLLVKSFLVAMRLGPGFNSSNLAVAQLELPATKYTRGSQFRDFAENALSNLRALPRVSSVGVASGLPFGGFGKMVRIRVPGRPLPQPGEEPAAQFTSVSPDYFSAMQIPLLKGRAFADADAPGNAPVGIINQELSRRFWPHQDPIGQKIEFGPQHSALTIVGVVGNVMMEHLRASPEPQMYVPLAQFPSPTLGFALRTFGKSAGFASEAREAIWHVDKDQPVSVDRMKTLMAVVDTANRVIARLMAVLGVLATLLSTIGIFGVMANAVAQRTNEIGIRMALGAAPGRVMRSVLFRGLKLASIGIVFGAAGALATTRLFQSMLYQVSPDDPWTFVGVSAAFAAISVLACYIPARRAMKVDPMVALRYE
ncbi:MAG TPA: ABC transporter permease [Candidatus Acidoferrales bacterium]|nr:ABC transporter permease [Candidatus Acidoferrales bacterium]